MLCNTEIKNERRHIILSSVVRVYNNITLPLFILNVDLTDPKNSSRITRIEINEDYHVPIDLLYAYASLPIFIAIDESEENVEQFTLKLSQLHLVKSNNRNSSLVFTISSHDNIIWISESVDLKVEGKDNYNEHIVIFRNLQQIILRMILRVDTFHESYRLLLYSSLWILNCIDLKLEFQIK
ncbi:unnamed protein product [Rotaria sp. Silwood1]|nr:unnamed protein product [Rotaria sp. Silwood1]CAF1620104.1 unnamed protein product [Rotaria sp. Silwood1]CAF3737110.1 unnamed protein product [Rotaria sp. Silwood1]CAF3762711.1 unnamed protein product [Rotaria sp. Silwood1]CAF3796563.1 unnamed protein product [Rotaria sp. Silwood1]